MILRGLDIMRLVFVSICIEMLLITPAAGAIIQVPADQPTIQAGINAAAPGDTVLVAAGTYIGAANRDLDFGGKTLVLRSAEGADMTTIDCQDQGRGLHFHSGEPALATVDGFTIRNGFAAGTFGGGFLIEGGATPTIRDCRLESNHANTGGGGFVASGVTLIDCELAGNTADNWGGGLYVEGSTMSASRCLFSQNGASIGAGLYLVSSSATTSDCSFTDNTPLNLAGGIYASGSTLVAERCSFLGNTGKEGAGMWLLGGAASIDSCTFRMNMAEYSGGGIRGDGVDAFTMTGCLFEDNAALNYAPGYDYPGGGGMAFRSTTTVTPYISDCVFVGNRALGLPEVGGYGGGMYIGRAVVERCVFMDNHADHNGGGANGGSVYRDCIFDGNTARLSAGLAGGYELTGCRFTNNHATEVGGACRPTGFGMSGGCNIVRCEFSGNSASQRGGGIFWNTSQSLAIQDCQFSGNYANDGGGIYMYCAQPTWIAGCTFDANDAAGDGGALSVWGAVPSSVTLSGCTLIGNAAPLGGGIWVREIPIEIENTILAFGREGEAVTCAGSGLAAMSCTNIYGNAGGDWTGCIADQLGINGCFSADPLFCNAVAGDYTLAETSPCAPAHSPVGCGLIGAHPVACAAPIGVADEGVPRIGPLLRVLPNPLRGAGTIEWMRAGVASELRLYDTAGRLVARRSGEGRGGRMSWRDLIRGGDMASGVYFLELGSDGGGEVAARSRLVVIR